MNPKENASSHRWTHDEDLEMCRLRDEGLNWAEIGKKLGRSRKACITRFSNRGYALNPLKGDE